MASNGGYFITKSPDSTTSTELFSVNGTNYFGSATNHDLRLRTNDLDRMTISANGSVEIGTTNPTVNLQVESGSTASTDFRLKNSSTNGHSWVISSLGQSSSLGGMLPGAQPEDTIA